MTPYDLGRASCVCRKWKYTIRNPVFWRNACLKAWQVNSIKGFEYRISTAYKITFLIMESLLWSYLELLKIIRYFNQNMMGLGGKCGCHDQGYGLMVRATISYCITLFLAPDIDWLCWVAARWLNFFILIWTNAASKCIIFRCWILFLFIRNGLSLTQP